MKNYSNKCSCGQPYEVEFEGDYPSRDTFTRDCPSCGNTLRVKASCLSTTWHFDESFKSEKNK